MAYASAIGDGDYPGLEARGPPHRPDRRGVGNGRHARDLEPRDPERRAAGAGDGQFERLAASPARVRALLRRGAENDARADLDVSVPTLVCHDHDNVMVPTELGRYIADHIPGAGYFEYPAATEVSMAETILIQSRSLGVPDRHTGRKPGPTGSSVPSCSSTSSGRPSGCRRGDHGWRADVEAFRATRCESGRSRRAAGQHEGRRRVRPRPDAHGGHRARRQGAGRAAELGSSSRRDPPRGGRGHR